MKYSTKLSDTIHILIFIALGDAEQLSSTKIAESIKTNPAYVRQLMATMKNAGIVVNTQGHANAALAKSADKINMYDIYRAVEGDKPLFTDYVDFDTFSKSDFRAVKVKECVAVPKSKKLLQFTLDDGTGTDRTILSGIHAYYEPEELVGKTLIAITNLPPRKMMGIESCGMLLSAVNNLKDSEDEELHLIMVDNHIPAGAKLY